MAIENMKVGYRPPCLLFGGFSGQYLPLTPLSDLAEEQSIASEPLAICRELTSLWRL